MSLYRLKCALSIRGTRVTQGEIVEMTPEAALQYGDDLVLLQEVVSKPEVATEEKKALDSMSKQELVEEADRLGLSTSGTKADLIERIQLSIND